MTSKWLCYPSPPTRCVEDNGVLLFLYFDFQKDASIYRCKRCFSEQQIPVPFTENDWKQIETWFESEI